MRRKAIQWGASSEPKVFITRSQRESAMAAWLSSRRDTHAPVERAGGRAATVAVVFTTLILGLSGCDPWDGLAIFTRNSPPPFTPDGVTAHRDVVYIQRPERALELDLYIPDDVSGPIPTVVYVHGGGYFMSNRHSVSSEATIFNLLGRGYAVATMDYRFSHEAIFPAQILDVTAALCWIKVHASDYGLDPERMALAGQSAGGHLASLAAVSHNNASDLYDDSCAGVQTRVQGVVDFFGPSNFDYLEREDSPLYHKIEQLFGGDLREHADLVTTANVLRYVDNDDPPFWIAHGDDDNIVTISQSEDLAATLGADQATFVVVAGGMHGGDLFNTEDMQQQVFDFLNTNVRDLEATP